MITPNQITFLVQMYAAARQAGHKWPAAAACESSVETGWGEHVPKGSKNVLGIKAYSGWTGPTVSADGTEQLPSGAWTGAQSDHWCVFADYASCFRQQMIILQEPRYAAAMAAKTMEGYDVMLEGTKVHTPGYIELECRAWSTGILKGQAVLQTLAAHRSLFA